MGEVRVTVRLSNAADMALVRRRMMRPEEVRSVEADALVDTGAVTFVLPSLVVEGLGLARPFKQVAAYADGRREEVDITEPVFIELMGRHTASWGTR
jgi:predicted aspartyl protease